MEVKSLPAGSLRFEIWKTKKYRFAHQVRSQGSPDQLCNSLERIITPTDDPVVMLLWQLIVYPGQEDLASGEAKLSVGVKNNICWATIGLHCHRQSAKISLNVCPYQQEQFLIENVRLQTTLVGTQSPIGLQSKDRRQASRHHGGGSACTLLQCTYFMQSVL